MAESENWQLNKPAVACHKYMLENSIATDVTFVVSNEMFKTKEQEGIGCSEAETLKAHKYQLICRSPVFYAMLLGDLAETGNIVVNDIDPAAFKQMLMYIYTDNVEIKPELAMPILYASKKYLLPGLTQVCVEYLEKQLSGENACILYDHSLLFDEPKLTERSLLMIKNKTKECLESSSMNYVRQSTLSKILDSDRLSTPEVDVFTACETWARYQVEQSGQEVTGEAMREVLGDCVFKIRYPNMKFKEFGTTVSPKGILLAEEELLMFRYFASEIEMSLPQNISSKNRYLPGPFTILTDANCAEMSISSCTTAYDITTDQTISINCVKLGDMKQGTDFYGKQVTVTCSQVKIDNTVFKVRAFHPGNPSVLYTDKSFNLYKDSKVTLQMTLNSGYTGSVSPSPKMKYVTSREMKMSDATTGLNVSVSSNNHMFLLGFTYDYNYL